MLKTCLALKHFSSFVQLVADSWLIFHHWEMTVASITIPIKSWLSILEASYIIKLLPPYFNNLGKRLIKAPKLYFIDTGLAAFLLGIQNIDHLLAHPLRGGLFENMIVSEFLKKRFNQGKTDNLYFLRDSKGREVDILLDYGSILTWLKLNPARHLLKTYLKGCFTIEPLHPNKKLFPCIWRRSIQSTARYPDCAVEHNGIFGN